MAATTAEAGATASGTTRRNTPCKIEGCKRPYRAKGYCVSHYQKWRRGELDAKPRYKICCEENCRQPLFKKGYCEQHYSAWSASKKHEQAKVETKAEEKPAEEPKVETEAKVEEKSAEEPATEAPADKEEKPAE